jgi:hypothetical protein
MEILHAIMQAVLRSGLTALWGNFVGGFSGAFVSNLAWHFVG